MAHQDGPATPDQAKEALTAALLRERDGYARYGRKDRVKEVDAELHRLGYRETTTDEPDIETTKEPRATRHRKES